MGSLYQRLAFLSLLVVVISGAVIYFTVDINTLSHVKLVAPWALALVLVMMAIGMYFDGSRLMHLVHIAGQRLTLVQAVQIIFSNYFLALLTPGAAGGAVAQLMFLRRAGVPTGIATVVVVIRTAMSLFVMFSVLPFVFMNDPGLLPWFRPQVLVTTSVVLLILIGASSWFLRSRTSFNLMIVMTKRLGASRRKWVFRFHRDIRGAILLILAAPSNMLRVFLESAANLLALYSMVPLLFMALGNTVDWPVVIGRMALLNILLYFAPTPGGSGLAEGGFIIFFNELLKPGTVGILAVAWRTVAEYIPFSIGLYFTVKAFGEDFLSKQSAREEN